MDSLFDYTVGDPVPEDDNNNPDGDNNPEIVFDEFATYSKAANVLGKATKCLKISKAFMPSLPPKSLEDFAAVLMSASDHLLEEVWNEIKDGPIVVKNALSEL